LFKHGEKMHNSEISQEEVLKANVEVHSALANSGEYNKSPHFNVENKIKVKGILKALIDQTPSGSEANILDLGCGTGFIVHLVVDMVARVDGLDITEDMMNKIDLSKGNIVLKTGIAEETGYPDNTFDMVTAYSFLDHLLDYKLVLKEAYRVLKKGGIFYSDLNPNRAFSNLLLEIESKNTGENLPHAISREIKGMLHNGELYEEEFGLSEDALTKAEPMKSYNRGFDSNEVLDYAKVLGFSSVTCELDWFLGQGVLMNSDSPIDLENVDDYLTSMLPATEGLYKYLRFIFVK